MILTTHEEIKNLLAKDTVISLRIDNTLLKCVDGSLPLAEAKSRNDFIKKAIQFYNAYLQLESDPGIYSKVIGDMVESKMNIVVSRTEAQHLKDVEQLARNQFKIATELAKIALVIGDNLNIPDERIADWHVKAIEEVKSLNGVLGFEDRFK